MMAPLPFLCPPGADFEKFAFAAAVFYGWIIVLPICMYFVLRWIGTYKSLGELVSLYGYSLAVWLPTSVCLFAY